MWTERDLVRLTRWSRTYERPDLRAELYESRFLDGTASVTLAELERDWAGWPADERGDFCAAFGAAGAPGPDDLLRFLVRHGDHQVWPAIALDVALRLPPEEAVPVLRGWCETCELGDMGANYYQAVSVTGSPAAHDILRAGFRRAWAAVGRVGAAGPPWRVAADALSCLEYLLGLGEDPEPFRAAYRTLMGYLPARLRESTARRMSRYFGAECETAAAEPNGAPDTGRGNG